MNSLIPYFLLFLLAFSFVHADVGPIRPDLHPDTVLEEAVRKMRLSVDQEKLYLARLREDKALLIRQSAAETEGDEDDGFTETVNDGTDLFEPILPGVSVPPADEFETDELEASPEDSPSPTSSASIIPTPSPAVTPEPSADVSPFESPEVSPVVTPEASPESTPVSTPESTPEATPVITPDVLLPTGEVLPVFTPDIIPTPVLTPDFTPDVIPTPVFTPDFTPDVSPEVSPDSTLDSPDIEDGGDDDDGVCFPATAKVQLDDGSLIPMEDIKLGDRVKVGHDQYSEVFMFTHKLANVRYSFLKIDTESGDSLTLTKGHYLYVNGRPAAASTVKVGDSLEIADRSISQVVAVNRVFSRGLFNPQTTHGDIIVDNVRATTYTTTVDRGVAHALLAPLRAAYCTAGWSLTAFDAGAKMLAGLVPSGSLI